MCIVDQEDETMLAEEYLQVIGRILEKIRMTQLRKIGEAAQLMADSIARGGLVHVFGSGHSVIPALDIFPRYGSFLGFHPLLDPRLMWFNVVGPGGVHELLWLERQEGYIKAFLKGHQLRKGDTILVFSHGGLNAAPIEIALEAKGQGLSVVAVTSLENYKISTATHSSGKKLADVADIVIDNCVPPEDALIRVDGLKEKVAAGSTVAVVAIAMALVAEIAEILVKKGEYLQIFVSPNVKNVTANDHNEQIFRAYMQKVTRNIVKKGGD
jgi:uncharacterized phosphosugar-binding protein